MLTRAHADGWDVRLAVEGLGVDEKDQAVVSGLGAQLDALAMIDLITSRHAVLRQATVPATSKVLRIVPGRFP
jgi:hypothetical protein